MHEKLQLSASSTAVKIEKAEDKKQKVYSPDWRVVPRAWLLNWRAGKNSTGIVIFILTDWGFLSGFSEALIFSMLVTFAATLAYCYIEV